MNNPQIDIGKISESLNNKADRDINNLTTGGYAKGSGLGMPSSRYIDFTLGATQSEYMAPANGWFSFAKLTGSTSNFNCLENATKQYKVNTAGSNTKLGVFLPVAKVTW